MPAHTCWNEIWVLVCVLRKIKGILRALACEKCWCFWGSTLFFNVRAHEEGLIMPKAHTVPAEGAMTTVVAAPPWSPPPPAVPDSGHQGCSLLSCSQFTQCSSSLWSQRFQRQVSGFQLIFWFLGSFLYKWCPGHQSTLPFTLTKLPFPRLCDFVTSLMHWTWPPGGIVLPATMPNLCSFTPSEIRENLQGRFSISWP